GFQGRPPVSVPARRQAPFAPPPGLEGAAGPGEDAPQRSPESAGYGKTPLRTEESPPARAPSAAARRRVAPARPRAAGRCNREPARRLGLPPAPPAGEIRDNPAESPGRSGRAESGESGPPARPGVSERSG